MPIIVQIPSSLRPCCGGAAELILSADSVRTALSHLEQNHEELYRCVCDETGAVRQHINLFVNSELIGNKQELDLRLESGDTLFIFPAVSGG